MKKSSRPTWFDRGNFPVRLAKQIVLVGPVAFLMCFYGFVRSSRLEFSWASYIAISFGVTAAMSLWFASQSGDQVPDDLAPEPSSERPHDK